jgi:serine/threonine-protein kinase
MAGGGTASVPVDTAAALARVQTTLQRASVLFQQGDCTGAVPLYREAAGSLARLTPIDGEREAGPAAGDSARAHPRLGMAEATGGLAICLDQLGRFGEARGAHLATLAYFRAHPERHQLRLAMALNNYGVHLERVGRLAEAERTHREALAAKRAILPASNPSLAASLVSLAAVLHARERLAEADSTYAAAVEMTRATLGSEHRRVAVALLGHGLVRHQRGNAVDAAAAFEEALRVARASDPPRPRMVRRTTAALGTALLALGRAAEAEPLLREALALDAAHPPEARAADGGAPAARPDYEARTLSAAAVRARWRAALQQLGCSAEARTVGGTRRDGAC